MADVIQRELHNGSVLPNMCYAKHQAMQATAAARFCALDGWQYIHQPEQPGRDALLVPVENQQLTAVTTNWPLILKASQGVTL